MTKAMLVYASHTRRWETATTEDNPVTGKKQWVRNDGGSYICDVGTEVAKRPLPALKGVAAITFADILTASKNPDLDSALKPLMDIAGIDDGGIASIVFSGGEEETWPREVRQERIKMLAHWAFTESLYEDKN